MGKHPKTFIACPTAGCKGDARYPAPERKHHPACNYPNGAPWSLLHGQAAKIGDHNFEGPLIFGEMTCTRCNYWYLTGDEETPGFANTVLLIPCDTKLGWSTPPSQWKKATT